MPHTARRDPHARAESPLASALHHDRQPGLPGLTGVAASARGTRAVEHLVKATRQSAGEYNRDALFPLEGVWELLEDDKTLTLDERVTPGKIMMRQADSVTHAEFDEQRLRLGQTIEKSQQRYLDAARLVTLDEGPCIQILHLGPYNDEPASFAILDRFLQDHQLHRVSDTTHREIYLVDARTAQPVDYQTVLRVQVADSPAR